MGDASGQCADGFHLLRLEELGFEFGLILLDLLSLGDIIYAGQNACPYTQLYQLSGKQACDDFTAFCPERELLAHDSLTFAKRGHNGFSIFIA
jgi:hypothetical protein